MTQDPEQASKFLVDLSVSKDLIIDSYKKSNMTSFTSHLPSKAKDLFPDYPPVKMEKRYNIISSMEVIQCSVQRKGVDFISDGGQ